MNSAAVMRWVQGEPWRRDWGILLTCLALAVTCTGVSATARAAGAVNQATLAAVVEDGTSRTAAGHAEHASVPCPPTIEDSFDRGMLWRVARNDRVVAHVLGTLHIGSPASLNLHRRLDEVVLSARLLVVEVVDTPPSSNPRPDPRKLPKGTRLEDLLGKASFAEVRRLAYQNAISADDLQPLQPWAALAILEHIEYLPARSLDDWLVDRATARGISVVGLETLEEQLKAAGCLTLREQTIVMQQTLARSGEFREVNERLLALYRAGDLKGLGEYSLVSNLRTPQARSSEEKERRCLIDQRNAVMGLRLDALLQQEEPPILVAVGALHLPGSNGVLSLLRGRGYEVCAEPD